jgi:predicted RNA-binding Zn-ribbon protein involved in translation (DUF1610 family)
MDPVIEPEACRACGGRLERLGGHRQQTAGADPVVIVHWTCPACGKQWMNHSRKGWAETRVDLRAD